MAIIKINAVSTKTSGGYDAEINGIDITSIDCLVGSINTPGAGVISVSWDNSGRCRDQIDKCNLDANTDDIQEVIKTVKVLQKG